MSKYKLQNYDQKLLQEAKDKVKAVYEYHYGAPNARPVVNRLETIISKIDALLAEENET